MSGEEIDGVTEFNHGQPADELSYLRLARTSVLEAMSQGAMIVEEIEIRGRIVKHNDLKAELDWLNNRIACLERKERGDNTAYRPARTRARLGR